MKKILFITLLLLLGFLACTKQSKVNVVFIGDSITQGVLLVDSEKQAPPVMAVRYLQEQGYDMNFANCGVSGYTTLDFLPEANQFEKVVMAADTLYRQKDVVLIFSVCLGTNDSAIEGPHGAPVSPEEYQTNMKVIIDDLLRRYPKSYVVLHQPIWYSPNTHNGARYLEEGLARLRTYTPQLEALVASNPEHILLGDSDAYSYFEKYYKEYLLQEEGFSGDFYLHPNELGAQKLGEFWARAIEKSLK